MNQTNKTTHITEELIHNVADATGDAVRERLESLIRECCSCLPNYYGAMVRLLRSYKALHELAEQEEDYMLLREHDRSITVAPPPGGVPKDLLEVREEKLDAKREAYATSMTQFNRLDTVVRQVSDRPQFRVIRMCYFGEDYHGNQLPIAPDKDRPWEEIVAEYDDNGDHHDAKTLRTWRNSLVREMVVLMWGVNGALSLEQPRESRRGAQVASSEGTAHD